MICDRVLGNVSDPSAISGTIDHVEVQWHQLFRRSMRLVSRAGERVDVILPPGARLRHNDILFQDDNRTLLVEVPPIELLILHPKSAEELGLLAFKLGNEHAPIQILDGKLLTLIDGPALALADRHGIAFTKESRRFHPVSVPVEWTRSRGL